MQTHLVADLAISTLRETVAFTDLMGRDGAVCTVWTNPSEVEFAKAIDRGTAEELAGLRGLLTRSNLYIWQSVNLLHANFERDTGIVGVRLGLRSGEVQANDETVATPEHFPCVFPDAPRAAAIGVDDRREAAAAWLRANTRLKPIYPCGFRIVWYS
jgi:hypothetical protein